MVLCFPHKCDLHFLVNPFFGIWPFLFTIPWKDTMSRHLQKSLHYTFQILHYLCCNAQSWGQITWLGSPSCHQDKQWQQGTLCISDSLECSPVQWKEMWDEQAQLKKKEQNIFIATSFSIPISLSSCRYAPHDIEQQGHLTRELRSASLEIKLSTAILSSGVFFLNLLLLGS